MVKLYQVLVYINNIMVLKPIHSLERLLLVYTKRWLYRNVEYYEKKYEVFRKNTK